MTGSLAHRQSQIALKTVKLSEDQVEKQGDVFVLKEDRNVRA